MAEDKSLKIIEISSRQEKVRAQVLEQLFHEHREALCTYIRRRARYIEEPEDIAQEVFLRIARRPDLVEKIRSGLVKNRAYIFSMANNLLADLERRRALQRDYDARELLTAEQFGSEPSPERTVVADRELEVMKRVIMRLKPNWRRVFVMSRFQYMSYREIAEKMGVSLKQVEGYMAQALVRIRDAEKRLNAEPGKQGGKR